MASTSSNIRSFLLTTSADVVMMLILGAAGWACASFMYDVEITNRIFIVDGFFILWFIKCMIFVASVISKVTTKLATYIL